jgi:CheY-like chemotaxis protein
MFDFHVAFSPESESLWKHFIEVLPYIWWTAVGCILVWFLGPAHIKAAFARVSKLSIGGVEFEFREEVVAATKARNVPVSAEAVLMASRRLAASLALVKDAKILWVDDQPAHNAREEEIFRTAGAKITQAQTTQQAIAHLKAHHFDVVISDIDRGTEPTAGLTMLEAIRQDAQLAASTYVVFYVGRRQPGVPPHAFGIADRPAELIHLVLDVLARLRS